MKKLAIFFVLLFLGSNLFGQISLKSDFVGVYKLTGAPFEKLIVSLEQNRLMAEAEGVGKGELLSTEKKDEFKEPINEAILTFERNESGGVEAVLIKVQDLEIHGVKEPNKFEEFLGKYKFEEGSPITELFIEMKDGRLFGDTDQGKAELRSTPVSDEFQVMGYNGKASFTRNGDGKINGVVLHVEGMILKATK
jgi:hypothetical protein